MSRHHLSIRATGGNKDMPKYRVTLDALIKREDLQVTSSNPDAPGGEVQSILIGELEEGRSMFDVVRKPDFQRETSEWTPEQIVELVKNVLDDELIPSVIVWKAPNRNVFVIDGAHRLSAIMAWINNDYGAGTISIKHFGAIDKIPKAQIEAHNYTKTLMEDKVGAYRDMPKFRKENSGGTQEQILRAKMLSTAYVSVQSVRKDAVHAESSFYRINQGGAVINEAEKEIILRRRRPEALAARALLRAGTGHEYWWEFKKETKVEIVELAKSVYDTLYHPELADPIRTLDLPMAGGGYSADALSVLYEFIHIANDIPRIRLPRGKNVTVEILPTDDPQRDMDGSGTIKCLKTVKKVTDLINSNYSGSFGFHPAVYSYSATGRFQPTAFLAHVQLAMWLREKDLMFKFTPIRKEFEEFLVSYKYFINQLIPNYGGKTKSLIPVSELFRLIADSFLNGKSASGVLETVLNDPRFSSRLNVVTNVGESKSPRFSKGTTVAIKLREALESAPRCYICNARYHYNGTTTDHREKAVRDGGSGSMRAGSSTHPYCNSGYKEKLITLGRWDDEKQQPKA